MSFKVVAFTGGVVSGIVLGAIGMEILQRANPELAKKMEEKMKRAGQAVKEAFEGKESVEEA